MSATPTVSLPAQLQSQVRYVPRHISHHGQYSGYDRVYAYMGLQPAYHRLWATLADRIPKGLAWRLWQLRPQPTQQEGLRAEMAALPWLAWGKKRLCHFIYGEDTFFYSPLWKRSGNACIATYHYPPQRLMERLNPATLRALDAVLIVGENQREYLARFISEEKIFFLPHHIDTDFFTPDAAAATSDTPPRLLCVGHLLRDFDTLLQAHRALRQRYPALETHIVAARDHFHHPIAAETGVIMQSGISDEALRQLYRTTTIGVQPLLDATANNALLEMMACGVAIAATETGGIPAYAHGSGVQLMPPQNADALIDIATQLIENPARRSELAAQNRTHAVNQFSLGVCAQRLTQLYQQLLSTL